MKIMFGKYDKLGHLFCFYAICVVLLFHGKTFLHAETGNGRHDINLYFLDLNNSIDQTILKEKSLLDSYTEELTRTKEHTRIVESELSALRVQYSVYSGLVYMPETSLKSLEQAFSGNLSAQTSANKILTEFKTKLDHAVIQLSQTEEQIRLNTDQLSSITSEKKNQPESSLESIDKLKKLLLVFNKKKDVLTTLTNTYKNIYQQFTEVEKQITSLSDTFRNQIKQKKKQALLQKKKHVFFTQISFDITATLKTVIHQSRSFFTILMDIKFLRNKRLYGLFNLCDFHSFIYRCAVFALQGL